MSMRDETAFHWIGLSSVPGVGRATFRRLLARFGKPERALSASREELKETGGLSDKILDGIASFPWQAAAERELALAAEAGVQIVTFLDPRFPAMLKAIEDPPLYLYLKGDLLPRDDKAAAVVGTRTPTHYGLTVAHRLSYELAQAGLTVVSGMARGVDTQAHKGALAAKGRTIAVLGCGIDCAYPSENKGLMEQISAQGAVVTEYRFGIPPEPGLFPARNRIISGLSLATVIIEAAEDSGSLITADCAVAQGRKLFAVPGNIGSPVSKGSNSLIKRGVALIQSSQDILGVLGMRGSAAGDRAGAAVALPDDEASVFRLLSGEPKHIDLITAEAGGGPGRIGGILTALELKGLAKQLPGKYFIRD